MLLFLNFFISFSFAQTTVLINGNVFNKKNELIYVEKHFETYSNKGKLLSLDTKYLDTNGKEFASLTSNFQNHSYVPEYVYNDTRINRSDGIKLTKKEDVIIAFAKPNSKKERKEKEFKVEDNLVSGQGLYAYVHSNFEKLLNMNKPIYIDFLIPMQQAKYSFVLEQRSKDQETVVYRIKFRNWLIRFFAPSIIVTYDIKTKKLLEYDGPSNVPGDKGEVQSVVIKYLETKKI